MQGEYLQRYVLNVNLRRFSIILQTDLYHQLQKTSLIKYDKLHDLVPFVRFKKRETLAWTLLEAEFSSK